MHLDTVTSSVNEAYPVYFVRKIVLLLLDVFDLLQYGSKEAAEEAMDASKDRSRKSELQTVSR